jgi:uncharacterized membrane protein
MHGINGMGWGISLEWILGLFVFVAVIWFIILVVKTNQDILNAQLKSAHDILNERYARGEIKTIL